MNGEMPVISKRFWLVVLIWEIALIVSGCTSLDSDITLSIKTKASPPATAKVP